MAIFKRADLKEWGLTDEQIERVMTEGNRSLAANYALKSDVQSQIDAALAAAKGEKVDIEQDEKFLAVVKERDMLRAIGGDDFLHVKPKFRETVFNMLDRSDGAPDISEQLTGIGEKYEEYFIPEDPKPADPPKTPQFGGSTQGSAPTGKTGPSFSDTWAFGPKK